MGLWDRPQVPAADEAAWAAVRAEFGGDWSLSFEINGRYMALSRRVEPPAFALPVWACSPAEMAAKLRRYRAAA